MAKKNEGRAVWFRMFRNIRNLVDAVPDESAGAAIKAVFAYFDTGELPTNLDTLGYALFLSIKPAVDESNEDYKRAVESGRKGSQKRWEGEDRPPIPSLTSPIAPLTEEEKETEKEIKKELLKNFLKKIAINTAASLAQGAGSGDGVQRPPGAGSGKAAQLSRLITIDGCVILFRQS